MGSWSKKTFGHDTLPRTAIMFGGTNRKKTIDNILALFDYVEFYSDSITPNYRVSIAGREITLIFGMYGAPLVIDMLGALKDGGCTNVIFLGYAYSDTLEVGSIFIPTKVACLDGITFELSGPVHYVTPDSGMDLKLKTTLLKNNHVFCTAPSVCVTSIFHKPHGIKKRLGVSSVDALEMELSSLYHFSEKFGLSAAGALVISDNKEKNLYDGKSIRSESLIRLVRIIISSSSFF